MLLAVAPLAVGCVRVHASITVSPDDQVSGQIIAAAKVRDDKDPGPQFDTNVPFSQKIAVSKYDDGDGYVGSEAVFSDLTFAELPQRVHALSERFLDSPVRLRVGRESETARWRELGLQVDEPALLQKLRGLGHSGDPLQDLQAHLHGRRHGYPQQLPVAFDGKKALEFLMELKDKVDRGPIDARLDLEKHTIAPDKPGYLLRVYDSLVTLEYAARALSTGSDIKELQLAVAETPPQVRSGPLESEVLARAGQLPVLPSIQP